MILRTLFTAVLATILCFSVGYQPAPPEEGMYPINFLESMDLKAMGLKIDSKEIFDPAGNGIVNAVVNIGGCTGSFISDNGLILTNHHCVFSGVQQHASESHNYVKDGFMAADKTKELPLKGFKVRIMKSFTDVSSQVLNGSENANSALEKDKIIRANIAKINLDQKIKNEKTGMESEVSEMLTGVSYILFTYDFIKDIRLVYVPPRYIGEFGGETDNWMWPRHSGDFSFVRAYVDASGNPSEYAEENVPYKPARFLKVNSDGVDESDLVFVLGYPGSTTRHYPASYIKYMQESQMPYIATLWEGWISTMEHLSTLSVKNSIKYSSRIKRFANTTKNYRGKMQSINRIDLYNKKLEEEALIAAKLKKVNPDKSKQFLATVSNLDRMYGEQLAMGPRLFWFSQMKNASRLHDLALFLSDLSNKPDADPSAALKEFRSRFKSIDWATDSIFAAGMLRDAISFKGQSEINGFKTLFTNHLAINTYIKNTYSSKNKLLDTTYLVKTIKKNPSLLSKFKNETITLMQLGNADYEIVQSKMKQLSAEIRDEMPAYVNAKMEVNGNLFIPDANATLRFTYGFVKGYEPSDALYTKPISTLNGILEKASKPGEYDIDEPLRKAIKENNQGKYFSKKLGSVPVNILYNTDTSGGNSGSPVLNEKGELVGLNFDRCFEACVNDFAWNDSYSRSIGVDVRYILWVTEHIGNAPHLTAEINQH